MIRFIILLLFIINLNQYVLVNGQMETACVGVDNGNFVNNPQSCAHFFGCENQQAHPGQCPPGYYFEPILQYCDFPNNVDCTQCSPRGIQTIAIEGSCTRYIRCEHGIRSYRQCQIGLHFDPSLGRCNIPSFCVSDSEEITEVPPPPPTDDPNFPPSTIPPPPPPPPPPPGDFQPDCTGAQIFHAHPTDCTRFFICVGGSALPGQCQNGQLWNQLINSCDEPENTICFTENPQPTTPPPILPPV